MVIVASTAWSCSKAPKAASGHTPSRLPAVDAIADVALRDGGAVGLSIVVMRGDQVVHAAGYGFADRERGVRASEHSVYPLASLSKQYWAVGIAQLVEQNRLSVEMPVADVLYKFPDRRVKVRHLLTQTSGLGDDAATNDDTMFTDAPTVAFEPGTWWSYSNRGSILARRVMEQVAGVSWGRYLRERIAQPLALATTTTCTMDNHVTLYDRNGASWSQTPAEVTRLAFVCADAIDVARFENSLDVGRVLRPETVAKMRAPTSLDGAALTVPYGWFTRIGDLDGRAAYGHTGTLPGLSVAAFRFPTENLTVVVLMNSAPKRGFQAHELVVKIARARLGLVEPPLADALPPKEELDAIAGTYAAGIARASLAARDGRARLTLAVNGKPVFEGPLAWVGGRSFAGGPDGVQLDTLATFAPATGTPRAILVGHRFLLEQVFRRE